MVIVNTPTVEERTLPIRYYAPKVDNSPSTLAPTQQPSPYEKHKVIGMSNNQMRVYRKIQLLTRTDRTHTVSRKISTQ